MERSITWEFSNVPPGMIPAIRFSKPQFGKGAYMPPVLPEKDTNVVILGPKLVKRDTIPSFLHPTMDFKDLSIRELLDYCLRTNDQAAWAELLKRVTPTVAGVVYKRLSHWGRPDHNMVQDLVQDTLLKLFDKERAALENFEWRHEDAIYGYVKVIASRVVADRARLKLKEEEESLEENYDSAGDAGSFQTSSLNKIQVAEVERCVDALDATRMEKDMFWLYFESGYSAREISEMPDVNLSMKGVENILARMVRQVKAAMKRVKGGAASSE